ncbi:Amidase domain-containing protein [Mycena venus]|uniref:amidase n=1 Tax=Mycena venus TaxID=2733690 RepID=A0A8H6Y1G5_9AGAR|nr:Amidase domain-containing protein [Mycena venus]
MTWQQIAAEKKSRQLDSVPKEWLSSDLPSAEALNVIDFPQESNVLSALDLEITESSVAGLLSNLALSKWSAVQVTTSFYKRAIVAQQLVKIFVDRALARAKTLDEHLKTTGQVVGALHGLPISLKDQISIKGIESTIGTIATIVPMFFSKMCSGYVSLVGQFAEKDSVLVDILESLGAIPFVKTNVPQTLMWPETFNHVFGRTTNPYNRSLTSGGSSGGEGALIALKGSPLGVGSDIGGSIRIPSAFCGVYGFRPSYNRIPYAGCVNSLEGEDSVLSVLGPLSNTLDGIKTFYKAVLSKEPWLKDPMVIRKRWSDEDYNLIDHGNGKKLCFAIMWDNGGSCTPPSLIDWVPHNSAEMTKTIGAIWNAGAAEDFEKATAPSGEPVIASMGLLQEDEAPLFRPSSAGISAFELWQLHKKKRDLRQEYLKHWEDTVSQTGTGRPVDAIISPIAPHTAGPHGSMKIGSYTMWLNLVDYPSMVIPVSQVDPALDVKQPREEFYSTEDQENHELYNPATYENAPISIQVIGRGGEEEAVIAMSEIVDEALRVAKSKL